MSTQEDWHEVNESTPEGVVLETKVHDFAGLRNQQPLKRRGNLWFFADDSMYVYYTPTHWRHLADGHDEPAAIDAGTEVAQQWIAGVKDKLGAIDTAMAVRGSSLFESGYLHGLGTAIAHIEAQVPAWDGLDVPGEIVLDQVLKALRFLKERTTPIVEE